MSSPVATKQCRAHRAGLIPATCSKPLDHEGEHHARLGEGWDVNWNDPPADPEPRFRMLPSVEAG